VLEAIDLDSILSSGYSFLIEMIFYVQRRGWRIGEVPIVFEDRVRGKSKISRIEIVRALESSERSLETIEAVSRKMGKETVLVREAPGFITSRVNASIGNEAFFMLMEGVATARDIDKALKLVLNHPMGPFELVDLVGLDTRLSILEYLHRSMGEKYRPCPLLAQYVKAGRLGKKGGTGV